MSIQHYPQFHRIILQDKKLRIPKKYVEKFWKGISNPIFLRFPNGVQQKIFWVKDNGDILFQKNWNQFAKSLKYGNLLTFKYKGGSCFKVKIFCVNALEINYSNIKSIVDEEEVVEAAEEEAKETIEVSDESEIPMQAQRTGNGKRKINMDLDSTQQKLSGSSSMVKKAKKCSTTAEAVNMRDTNENNPFFDIIMTKTYADGKYVKIPMEFSREHLNNFQGIATLFVGEKMAMEVNLRFDQNKKRSIICAGWKLFSQKYNLQIGDACKFVMTQREPLLFTIIINRARKEPNPKMLQGYKEGISSDTNVVKREDTGGISSSCPKVHFFYGKNIEGVVKKANKCSTIAATVNMIDNNQNPFFEVILTKSYADGTVLRIPSEFSREHLNNFQGIATLFVGEEMAMEVNMRFDHCHKASYIYGRWKLFSQKYNLQVGDACKFVMTQREPLLFTIIINRARKEPNSKMLQGYKEEISSDNNLVIKREDTVRELKLT
ncbi:B3 domain-containing transcription factor VRN1 [Trifolium repens]|nr:B3 domain-containing transcription factor VRN1 [Trifolium repens]